MERGRPDIQIRTASPEDAPRIASVLRDSFEEYERLYTRGGFNATTPAADEIRSRMKEGPVWVALRDGRVVGTGSAVPRGEELYVRGMAVLPAARGQGIGKMLLERIEDFASAGGYKLLVLSTTPFLTSAIRLYENFGFRRSDEGARDLFGTPLFTMVKTLGVTGRGGGR